jgi:hypothetical protein
MGRVESVVLLVLLVLLVPQDWVSQVEVAQ